MAEGKALISDDFEIDDDLPLPSDKKYHVYFAYADSDREWVQRVISCLEKEHNIKCCDRERDFINGGFVMENISLCISQSIIAVSVVSKQYNISELCKYELFFLKPWETIVIPLIIEECEIPHPLTSITYLDCTENKELWFPRLVAAISNYVMKDTIPDVIKKMDNRSIKMYTDMLKTGSERRRDIRIILVGKKGSGKTSLVRNLLRQDLSDVTETNGVEIHVKECKIRCRDWTWIPSLGYSESCSSRLKKMFKDFSVHATSEKSEKSTDQSNTLQTDTASKHAEVLYLREDEQNDNLDVSDMVTLRKRIEESFQKMRKSKDTTDEFANVYIWDFAGDEEFYNTHMMFFAKEVIYLVLTKLNDDCKDKTGAFRFWFDSVHCLCDDTPDVDNGPLDPPVIVVGTHTDMLEGNGDKCVECLKTFYDDVPPKLRNHIRDYTLLSNTKDPDEKIDELQQKILETAKKARNWDTVLPVKFILLEEKMESHKVKRIPIVSFTDIALVAKETHHPITEQGELDLFLRYHHEIGNLIYFSDLPEHVILNAQWLADIFKLVVTADQFQLKYPGFDWKEVRNTGKLNKQLLDRILSEQTESKEQQSFLLKVFEKFDILVRPRIPCEGSIVKESEDYYVPCMVKRVPIEDLDKIFEGLKPKYKSTILCLEFQFLPPTVFNKLLVSCCRNDNFTSSKIKINGQEQLAFFMDMAIFDVTLDGCVKLILGRIGNIIQLQVLYFGKKRVSLGEIREFITEEIKRIYLHRYAASQLTFKTKMKCPDSKLDILEYMRDYTQEMVIEEYFCIEHGEVHTFNDDWFGCKSPKQISSDQLNFVRMGMISLDIFGDVLYDLLKLDTSVVHPRSTCDVTSLYREHRNLNKHVPSTKNWGGGRHVEDVLSLHKAIGDDIERIRLIRNEIAHSKSYLLPTVRCTQLYSITADILKRFDVHLKPPKPYLERLKEIKEMTYNSIDLDRVQEQLSKDCLGNSNYYAEQMKVEHHYHFN